MPVTDLGKLVPYIFYCQTLTNNTLFQFTINEPSKLVPTVLMPTPSICFNQDRNFSDNAMSSFPADAAQNPSEVDQKVSKDIISILNYILLNISWMKAHNISLEDVTGLGFFITYTPTPTTDCFQENNG